MEDKMIDPLLIAIGIYALTCCVDWSDIFSNNSKASALRDLILESKLKWTYLPIESIPA